MGARQERIKNALKVKAHDDRKKAAGYRRIYVWALDPDLVRNYTRNSNTKILKQRAQALAQELAKAQAVAK